MPGLPDHIAYTKVPNFIIEVLMADLRGGELKVAIAICRKTFGFHKKADGIALSQIMDLTGLTKKTVIDSLRSLVKKKVIYRNNSSIPYQYSINVSNHIDAKPQKHKNTEVGPKPDGGIESAPRKVQELHRSGVQKLNPQKKPVKETERNTTGSSAWSVEIVLISEYWSQVFNTSIDLFDTEIVDQIKNCLDHFSIEEIKKAIFNRSRSSYYRKSKPFLIDKPTAFFPYVETVTNDLHRTPEGIYTYDEKNERIFQRLNTDDDFQIMPELKDEQGRPKWELKKILLK